MSRCEDGGIRWQRVSAAVMVGASLSGAHRSYVVCFNTSARISSTLSPAARICARRRPVGSYELFITYGRRIQAEQ